MFFFLISFFAIQTSSQGYNKQSWYSGQTPQESMEGGHAVLGVGGMGSEQEVGTVLLPKTGTLAQSQLSCRCLTLPGCCS